MQPADIYKGRCFTDILHAYKLLVQTGMVDSVERRKYLWILNRYVFSFCCWYLMTLHYTKIFSTLLGRYMPKLSKIVITLKFYQLHTKISILTETAFLVKRGNYSNKLKNLLNLFTNSLNFTFHWEIPDKGNSKRW